MSRNITLLTATLDVFCSHSGRTTTSVLFTSDIESRSHSSSMSIAGLEPASVLSLQAVSATGYVKLHLARSICLSLHYQDLTLVLQRVVGRSWRLIYRLDQRWVKNNRDPENVVYVSCRSSNFSFEL